MSATESADACMPIRGVELPHQTTYKSTEDDMTLMRHLCDCCDCDCACDMTGFGLVCRDCCSLRMSVYLPKPVSQRNASSMTESECKRMKAEKV